jgi:hypothetical protein
VPASGEKGVCAVVEHDFADRLPNQGGNDLKEAD